MAQESIREVGPSSPVARVEGLQIFSYSRLPPEEEDGSRSVIIGDSAVHTGRALYSNAQHRAVCHGFRDFPV